MTETVLVTGGADSVGRVMAEAFAARGDRVHICDVRPDAVAATLAANPGMRGTIADVGDPAALARVVEENPATSLKISRSTTPSVARIRRKARSRGCTIIR